jgi:FAD/FMN-containing dehydrogenase
MVELMKTLKMALDPKGILNPGKIFTLSEKSPK